ncbi:MAG: HDOD domain-containing protein [Proteobacteria bacterium]|nr:HDOD domain-containing protein [Pseudomonadota bacterium]
MSSDKTSKLVAQLEQIVLGRIAAGKLVLPIMPIVATKCMAILRDNDFQQKKLVTQIETEPLLAAMILRSALAAAHGGGTVANVDQAVARIGSSALKALIIEYMARELFRSADTRIQQASKKVWEHSLAVAHLARDIAALTGGVDSDVCYLAGLLHDVGKPVIAAMLLECERHLGHDMPGWMDVAVWSGTIELLHRKVGIAIATEWKLPDDVAAGIRDCSDYDVGNRKCAANVVRFANALAKREGFVTGPIDADDVDALIMVGRSMIGADDALIARLAGGLVDRVSQTAA